MNIKIVFPLIVLAPLPCLAIDTSVYPISSQLVVSAGVHQGPSLVPSRANGSNSPTLVPNRGGTRRIRPDLRVTTEISVDADADVSSSSNSSVDSPLSSVSSVKSQSVSSVGSASSASSVKQVLIETSEEPKVELAEDSEVLQFKNGFLVEKKGSNYMRKIDRLSAIEKQVNSIADFQTFLQAAIESYPDVMGIEVKDNTISIQTIQSAKILFLFSKQYSLEIEANNDGTVSLSPKPWWLLFAPDYYDETQQLATQGLIESGLYKVPAADFMTSLQLNNALQSYQRSILAILDAVFSKRVS